MTHLRSVGMPTACLHRQPAAGARERRGELCRLRLVCPAPSPEHSAKPDPPVLPSWMEPKSTVLLLMYLFLSFSTEVKIDQRGLCEASLHAQSRRTDPLLPGPQQLHAFGSPPWTVLSLGVTLPPGAPIPGAGWKEVYFRGNNQEILSTGTEVGGDTQKIKSGKEERGNGTLKTSFL